MDSLHQMYNFTQVVHCGLQAIHFLLFRESKAKIISHLKDFNIFCWWLSNIKRKYKRNPDYTMMQVIIHMLQNLRESKKESNYLFNVKN